MINLYNLGSMSRMYGRLDWTYLLVILGAILSLIASSYVKSTFNKYARVANRRGLSGAEAARMILKEAGVYDVTVVKIRGNLTDNFNSRSKQLSLSESVYDSASVAALGVAAHECGHAIQYNEDYSPLKIRSYILPIANFGSRYGIWIIFAGVIISVLKPLITIGIILFAFGLLFQLVTLPIEFDASHRAIAVLDDMELLEETEIKGAQKVLRSAAMTYVASAAATFLTLLRLILIFGGGRGRRRR